MMEATLVREPASRATMRAREIRRRRSEEAGISSDVHVSNNYICVTKFCNFKLVLELPFDSSSGYGNIANYNGLF